MINLMKTGVDPEFGQEGTQWWLAQFFQCTTEELCKQSEFIRAWGLGPTLEPQKLCGFHG